MEPLDRSTLSAMEASLNLAMLNKPENTSLKTLMSYGPLNSNSVIEDVMKGPNNLNMINLRG
jgi:hypothetical protein